ncbi:unnamed protein product [Cladocopium goreaui]|uniref:Uncharacterized protein n=1 Tax=Cladocopium goreaui TaxID=2562237 RepID=A0A9P1G8W3_9DINO|nr:unnamed protein product [Cladocopium goreaui]
MNPLQILAVSGITHHPIDLDSWKAKARARPVGQMALVIGQPPLFFVLTNMFRGVGEEDMADLHRRLEESKCSYPEAYCSLWLCTRDFGRLPAGFPKPEGFTVSNDDITGAMYSAMLAALESQNGARPTSDALARLRTGHPAAPRVVHEMCKEWERGQKMVPGEDFVYSKESGRYCALQSGRANPKAWSLALECRNFNDSLSKEIFYQECDVAG